MTKTASSVEWSLQALKQACSQEYPESAMCVQSLDDSLDSAIRITYRISLRSSSLREPRYPSLTVVFCLRCTPTSKRKRVDVGDFSVEFGFFYSFAGQKKKM